MSEHRINYWYEQYALPLCLIGTFFLPLKLSLCYCFLLPALALTVLRFILVPSTRLALAERTVSIWLLFTCSFLVTAPFGLDPEKSLLKVFVALGYVLAIPMFRDTAKRYTSEKLLAILLAGQAVAAMYAVVAALLPFDAPEIFIGKVTQSGQLALTTVIALGLWFSHRHEPYALRPAWSWQKVLLWILPLCLAALLINLKRGPWFGVAFALALVLLRHRWRLIIPAAILVIIVATQIAPIRNRIADSYNDFAITGGRSVIWQIGYDLATRYPLGIGYGNSPVLRNYSADIPPELRHFHNNFLNILVEGGALALCLWIWALYVCISAAFRSINPLGHTIACALLSWQIAGLVEYNAGDSEVLLIVFLLLGISSLISNAPCAGPIQYPHSPCPEAH